MGDLYCNGLVTFLASYLRRGVQIGSHPYFHLQGQREAQKHFYSRNNCWSQQWSIDDILLANTTEQMQM